MPHSKFHDIYKRPVETLTDFYNLMYATATIRREMVQSQILNGFAEPDYVACLRDIREILEELPRQNGSVVLKVDSSISINVELGYETDELDRDILFFDKGEQALYEYLYSRYSSLEAQVAEGVERFKNVRFRNFITDRDGTVNNYCGRYLSSIQSAYNAVFLSRFAKSCAMHSIILTSAPLERTGLIEMSVAPPETFTYAGSKGREYFSYHGIHGYFPIDESQRGMLELLDAHLMRLLDEPENRRFSLIGSGFQRKFGQTTVARQDISGSVPPASSERFLEKVRDLVQNIDPEQQHFRIEDTGKDIEIILTIQDQDGVEKDFDKGNGMIFLDHELDLNLEAGPNLICGDTMSDIPMLARARQLCNQTNAIFITTDAVLKAAVGRLLPDALIFDTPDALVVLCNDLSKMRN